MPKRLAEMAWCTTWYTFLQTHCSKSHLYKSMSRRIRDYIWHLPQRYTKAVIMKAPVAVMLTKKPRVSNRFAVCLTSRSEECDDKKDDTITYLIVFPQQNYSNKYESIRYSDRKKCDEGCHEQHPPTTTGIKYQYQPLGPIRKILASTWIQTQS